MSGILSRRPPDPASGAPCWVDVPTSDPAASREFYSGLFGWQYQVSPDAATGNYTFALLDGEPVAGLYTGECARGQLHMWTLYLEVADVVATGRLITRLGGAVLAGPMEIQGQGHMLLATDASGAKVGFWQTTRSWQFGVGVPGALAWAELNTRDGEAADEFFFGLFGYEREQIGDGVDFDYMTWSIDNQRLLGRLRMGREFPPEVPAHWMIYFGVNPQVGTDALTERAAQLGGRVCIEPFDSPHGRLAILEDVSGATFSVIDTSRRLVAEEVGAGADDPYDD